MDKDIILAILKKACIGTTTVLFAVHDSSGKHS